MKYDLLFSRLEHSTVDLYVENQIVLTDKINNRYPV